MENKGRVKAITHALRMDFHQVAYHPFGDPRREPERVAARMVAENHQAMANLSEQGWQRELPRAARYNERFAFED